MKEHITWYTLSHAIKFGWEITKKKCQFKQIDTNSFTTRAIRDRQKKGK